MATSMGTLRHLTRNALKIPLRQSIKRQYLRLSLMDVNSRTCGRVGMSSLAAPDADDSQRHYPNHIKKIVDDISKLTLLEVSELNELLKVTLKIQDVPMMAAGAMAPPAAAQEAASEEAEKEAEPTEFTVKLTGFDAAAKVKLIKEIKNLIPGMNLVQAKKFVEGLPQNVREKVNKEESEQLKKALEAAGGTVEIET
ncbi:39S ribosomal protein L12, mitochondrial isoform X2 [Nematostella vectensis]|uniref:39S ribosomal protein L12, mitochondrial isoform X2 n=1 Tax=Nematostella vectensis TaxID=45351 RepID=UPI0020778193|nr:39S ribosomal protein L12, mitochondrial isoform X2 [Nematostella vectensis]